MIKNWTKLALLLNRKYHIYANIIYDKFKTKEEYNQYLNHINYMGDAFLIKNKCNVISGIKQKIIIDGIIIPKKTKSFKIIDFANHMILYWNGKQSKLWIKNKCSNQVKEKLDNQCIYNKIIIINKII